MFLWNSQCDEINQTGANKYWKKKIESLIKSAFGELNVAQQKKNKTKQNRKKKKKNGSNYINFINSFVKNSVQIAEISSMFKQ